MHVSKMIEMLLKFSEETNIVTEEDFNKFISEVRKTWGDE